MDPMGTHPGKSSAGFFETHRSATFSQTHPVLPPAVSDRADVVEVKLVGK